MSLGHGSSIVRDGLVLYLDAGNNKSYPGSGTVWTDLSVSRNDRTLLNSPQYNASYGGRLSFDGINDHSSTSPILTIDAECEGGLTYEYWIEPTQMINLLTESISGTSYYNPGTPQGLAGNISYKYNNQSYAAFMFSFGTNGFIAGAHNNGYAPPILVHLATYSGISHLTVIKNQYNCSYYVNGEFKKSSQTITKLLGDTFDRITATNEASSYFGKYFKGNIYSVKFYKRALSAQEIQQNFEASRGRYGI